MISLSSILDDSSEFAALSLLALVQGLTEFLPISSSGHLVLTQTALGFEQPALALDIALHVGTLLAVLCFYRASLLSVLRRALGGQPRELILLGVATLPTALVGLLLKDQIEGLFHDSMYASLGLLLTAGILLCGEWARRRLTAEGDGDDEVSLELTWRQALLIGCAQTIAILPGISRSGSTIAAGMLVGLAPAVAARFSFLLSIPAILGAALLGLPDALEGGMGMPLGPVVWGVLFAGFVGWGALKMLLSFLGRGAFSWFAIYCIALGSGSLLFL